jgi:hypothetical protein
VESEAPVAVAEAEGLVDFAVERVLVRRHGEEERGLRGGCGVSGIVLGL